MEFFFSVVSKVSRYGLWLGFTFSFPPFFPVIGRVGRGSREAPNLKHDLKTVKSKFQVVEVQEVAETGLHKFYKN